MTVTVTSAPLIQNNLICNFICCATPSIVSNYERYTIHCAVEDLTNKNLVAAMEAKIRSDEVARSQ